MTTSLEEFLKEKLKEIQDKNPRFSMRSFARKIGISAGAMAELLKGKRPLSSFYADRISTGLSLSQEDNVILFSFIQTRSRKLTSDRILAEKELAMITGWENYAILNLMKTAGFQSDAGWIAERLGLSKAKVEKSLAVMTSLNLISNRNGQLKRTSHSIGTSKDIPSSALVTAHKNDLLKAIEVLESTPPNVRSFTSITMPVNIDKIQEAKEIIRDFRRRMCLCLEDGKKQEVYNLNIQLFPVSRLKSQERNSL